MKLKHSIWATIGLFLLACISGTLYIFESFMPGNYNIPGNTTLYGTLLIIFLVGYIIFMAGSLYAYLSKKNIRFLAATAGMLIGLILLFYLAKGVEQNLFYSDVFPWLIKLSAFCLGITLLILGYKATKKPIEKEN